MKSIYEFDDQFTAQAFGFGTADNYYATQSANQFLDRIRVPSLAGTGQRRPVDPLRGLQPSGILHQSPPALLPWITAATSALYRKPSRASGWTMFSYNGWRMCGTKCLRSSSLNIVAQTASFREATAVAADSLRSSKLRSFLTLFGIILATTTLIAVMSVIHGMDVYIANSVSNMGAGRIPHRPYRFPRQLRSQEIPRDAEEKSAAQS